jgi:hypothetical protein
MTYRETADKLARYRREIAGLRAKMREAQASIEPEPVQDYEFAVPDGKVHLWQSGVATEIRLCDATMTAAGQGDRGNLTCAVVMARARHGTFTRIRHSDNER